MIQKSFFTDKVSKANVLIRQLNNSAGNPARELNLIRFMLSCLECAENDMLYADLEKTGDFDEVEEIQNEILNDYADDFPGMRLRMKFLRSDGYGILCPFSWPKKTINLYSPT